MICSCMRRWKVYRNVSPWYMQGNAWVRRVTWIAKKGDGEASRPFGTWREAYEWACINVEMEREKHDAHFIRESLYGRS